MRCPSKCRFPLWWVVVLASVSAAAPAFAATYRVGPGRTYTTLQQVATLLNPGDLVEVDGDATYPGDATFRRPGTTESPIVIRGIRVNGKRPVISGGTNTVHFRTDEIGSGADHYVFEGFEVTGGSFRCIFHQANDLTLRDLVVHDCPAHGILGADWGSGSMTMEFTEVYRCGSGDSEHQVYMATDEDNYPDSVFRMQYSYVHDGTEATTSSRAQPATRSTTTASRAPTTTSWSCSAPSAATRTSCARTPTSSAT